jgi:hypothetical protein
MQVIDLRDQGIEFTESSNQILQLEVFSCSLVSEMTQGCSDGTHVGTGGCLLIPPIGRILVCTAAAVGVLGPGEGSVVHIQCSCTHTAAKTQIRTEFGPVNMHPIIQSWSKRVNKNKVF